jgi:hypothetical protein
LVFFIGLILFNRLKVQICTNQTDVLVILVCNNELQSKKFIYI